jgi:molybdopterin molybdotransferase
MNAITHISCHGADLPRVDEILALLSRRPAPIIQTETVALPQALGRLLAGPVTAQISAPPCDRSAMDGYAFRFGDKGLLLLAGSARAGKPYSGTNRQGQCIAIATGGTLPDGCDTVAMREQCDVVGDRVTITAQRQGANIRRKGEDFQAGSDLLPSGIRIGPRQMGLLAAAGVESVAVRRPLRIAILSMGDELAGAAPDGIRDANRPMLLALCAANGFAVSDLGILPDNRAHLAQTLARAAADHDVIITSAGTSAGDEDHMLGAMLDCGGRPLIAGAAIKPGKPVAFGEIGSALCVALPGNPAAAYITFLILGLPLLRRLSAAAAPPIPWHQVAVGFDHRKRPELREYLRVRLCRGNDGNLRAERCGGDGSAMLASLAAGDGLLMLAEDETRIRQGDLLPFATFQALETV